MFTAESIPLIILSLVAGVLLVALLNQRKATDRAQEDLREANRAYSESLDRSQQELKGSNQRISQLLEERTAEAIKLAQTATKLSALEAKALSDRVELEKLQKSFRIEFQNLANEILEQKSKQFTESNRNEIEGLLKPFRVNISEFKERVEKIYSEENIQRGALQNEIKNLMELNRKMTDQTHSLTNALKGNSKTQGDWGEMILETILEGSNLVHGIHYTTQSNIKDSHGNNLRPDVVLNLPEGKQIVIDSKVSLTAFVDHTSATDPVQRELAMKNHISSVRKHALELGNKEYQKQILGSPDFVIMFLANEPAFLAALQNDPTIWTDAYNRQVIVSSPTNLFALLKIVDDLWKRDSQSKNAIAIAEHGAALYDKFVGFCDTFARIGKSLDASKQSYDDALKQLSTGRGNLVNQSHTLLDLGVKAKKSLPQHLVERAEESE